MAPLIHERHVLDPQWAPEIMDSTKPYILYYVLCFFSYVYIALHLKEALYSFSLAHLNCQHHYFCALGALIFFFIELIGF